MTEYWRLTNKEENHHRFQYRDGLNVDVLPFNPKGRCEPGGLYFFDREHLHFFPKYVQEPYYIRKVTLLPDSRVYTMTDTMKTDKFFCIPECCSLIS